MTVLGTDRAADGGETRPETDNRLDYQMLVEQLPGAVYRAIPDARGAWTYVSPQIQKITGVSAARFESDPELWLSLIHPEDHEAVLSVEDRVAATGEPYLAEYRMVRPDGEVVWVRDEAVVLCDEAGGPLLQGVLIDITQRKQSELEMESSVSSLQATLEATADGILVVDPTGKVLRFNQKFLQLWRIPDELAKSGDDASLLTHVVEQLVDPAGFLKRIQELYADPDSEDFDIVEFKDGRVYERFSIPSKVGGQSVGRVWSFRDRTGQRAAAEQLRVSESRLRTIVESEPECVKLIDRDGALLEMNPAGLRMIEADNLEDVAGMCVYDMIAVEDREAFAALNAEIFRGERGALAFDLIGLKGGRRRIETHAVPYRDASGEVIAQLAITRDVTDRAHLEDQLLQSQKLEAVGRLAGGIAHDFNNVLTVIANYAGFIKAGLPSTDPFLEDAEEIIRASDRAASLVRQLLAFSRKEVVRPRVFDLNEVIGEIERLLGRTIGDDIEVEVKPMGGPAWVLMDPGKVEQLLLNLGLNARDAMPHGGALTVTSSLVELDQRSVASLPDVRPGSYACLTVSDTGVGIDDDVRTHLFEPFFTTKRRGQGTGLGLASVYGIVKQAGGHVVVESETGRGSSFYVYLPVTDERPIADPQALVSPPTGGGERIMLVEDEAPVRRLVSRILEGAGYNVVAWGSGVEALDQIGPDFDFDLLLTDVLMPGMSGVDLANHLVARQSELKVLLMSGYAAEIISDQGAHEDHPLLLKPFGKEELLTEVRAILADRPSISH